MYPPLMLIATNKVDSSFIPCSLLDPDGMHECIGWIDEKVYPLPFDAETMIKKIRSMRDTDLEKITVSGLLGDWPNTYTFTKAMTETLLIQKRGRVPLVICRPSIIGSCWKEPVPGWVDVISAAGAVYMSVAFGVLKFLPGDVKSIADIVPADYVVNAMLASIPAIYNQVSLSSFVSSC
jgi:hypothetical protein